MLPYRCLSLLQRLSRSFAKQHLLFLCCGISLGLFLPRSVANSENLEDKAGLCGTPALAALKQHKVAKGETLASIAKTYQLAPATIMGLNPPVRNGEVKPNQILQIPPFDGIVHRLGNDDNYRSIAKQYNTKADVLFERNGCQNSPKVVFVPDVLWKPNPKLRSLPRFFTPDQPDQIVIIASGGYPLPFLVPVTSLFGWRVNPVTGEWAFHSGIDLGAPLGTPVLAASDGIVTFAGWGGGYGNLIEIDHGNTGTRYAHLSTIVATPGQKVVRGQQIGTVGSTGRSTGPHLHFEILSPSTEGWAAVDPAPYLNRIARSL